MDDKELDRWMGWQIELGYLFWLGVLKLYLWLFPMQDGEFEHKITY